MSTKRFCWPFRHRWAETQIVRESTKTGFFRINLTRNINEQKVVCFRCKGYYWREV